MIDPPNSQDCVGEHNLFFAYFVVPPRSLEKGASQGPPGLVNLPPQWGPDGRQQSASVIDADGRHLLRQLGGQRSWGPLCADIFYSIISCMYYR